MCCPALSANNNSPTLPPRNSGTIFEGETVRKLTGEAFLFGYLSEHERKYATLQTLNLVFGQSGGGVKYHSENQKNTPCQRRPSGIPFRSAAAYALRRSPAFSYTHILNFPTIRTALSPAGANAIRRSVLIQPADGVGPGDERSTFMLLNNGMMTETGIRNGWYTGSPNSMTNPNYI
jgi:hypothetical protein